MDNKIIVKINMFDMDQSIYLPTGEAKISSLKNLPHIIPDLCYEYNIYDVELHGVNSFTYKLAQEIQEKELTHYNENKIKIKGVEN